MTKQSIFQTMIYGATAVGLWNFFDVLGGLQPSNHPPPGLVQHFLQIAQASTLILVIAFGVSIFSIRYGAGCGLLGCLFAWPYWGLQIVRFPWKIVIPLLTSSVGGSELAAILMVIVSTAYTLTQLSSFRGTLVRTAVLGLTWVNGSNS